jgi:hypothetical protein
VKLENTGVFPFCLVNGAAPAVAVVTAAIATVRAKNLLKAAEILVIFVS